MLTQQTFKKILNYLDQKYCENKTSETNWNYYGLIFDYHFENSILSIDYLDIYDYLEVNGDFSFIEDTSLAVQYSDISENRYLLLIQNLLNILYHSHLDKDQNINIIARITKVLNRENIKIIIPENGNVILKNDDILDNGSYCNIIKMPNGLLRKELKIEYRNDEKFQKRMNYEFENMKKLSKCPQILNVIDFDIESSSYTMEKADMNLLTFLSDEIELSFEEKIKIITDILKGMNYAHENSIIHRDLHLGNVLKIGNDFVICDFGLSKDISILKSLKTSYTEKNNHIFVDPLAINDFRLLDKQSDIYSIGKMIDYIFTYNATTTDHPLKTIVERCISREKVHRYDSIDKIMVDIDVILKYQSGQLDKAKITNQILNNQYESGVHKYILDLVSNNKLSDFIVKHKLNNFGKLIMQFESIYQIEILTSIESGYSEATGYGGWSNYDIFAEIAYYLCSNLKEMEARSLAYSILKDCASIRYFAKNLFEKLEDE